MARPERADQELSLRGRPMDLAPIQVQLLPAPQIRRMRPPISRRATIAFSRHRKAASACVFAGLAAGAGLTYFEQPVYTAIAVIQAPAAETPGAHSIEFKESAVNPQQAAERANSHADQWIQTRREAQQRAAVRTAQLLAPQLAELEQRRNRAQAALESFARTAGPAVGSPTPLAALKRTQDLREDLAAARSLRGAAEKSYFAGLRQSGPEHADTRRAKEAYQAAAAREQSLLTALQQADKSAGVQSVAGVRFAALQEEAEAARKLYQSTFERLQQARTASTIRAAEIGLIQTASIPTERSAARNWPRNLLAGLLGGLSLAAGLILWRERIGPAVHDAYDVADAAGVTVLGEVPDQTNPANAEAVDEAFRSTLASLWLSGAGQRRPRLLTVTSPTAGDGKTTVAANLAIALANTNRRVLLIDGNVRDPKLHHMFALSNDWGFADVLAEPDAIDEYPFDAMAKETDVTGLYVMPAGVGKANIASMRYLDRLHEILLRFRLEFHAVLIDTPSMDQSPDARILGRLSDGMIAVARCGTTRPDQMAHLVQQLHADDIHVAGAILNHPPKARK